MADIKIFNPDGLAKPPGTYTHIAQARTQQVVFIAGQVPSDASGKTVGKGDIEAQSVQVYANILTALRAVGADWNNVVQFTSYLTRAGVERFQAAQKGWTKAQAQFERAYGAKRAKALRTLLEDVTSRELAAE